MITSQIISKLFNNQNQYEILVYPSHENMKWTVQIKNHKRPPPGPGRDRDNRARQVTIIRADCKMNGLWPSVVCAMTTKSSPLAWAGRSTAFAWNVLQFTPCGVYLWLESPAEIINVSYRMDSAIAPDRYSASAQRADSSRYLFWFRRLRHYSRRSMPCRNGGGRETLRF